MLRHVWVATCSIPHDNGWNEKYIEGVFASKEVAERVCRAEGEWGGHGPFKTSHYADGDVYLDDATGHRRYVIQPHPVEYQPVRAERVASHDTHS